MRHNKASAFQIMATVGLIIAAFMLLMIMTVEKVKKDTINIQQYGKEYTGVIVQKGPEYTGKSSEQAAYQAAYETGLRGGLTNETLKNPAVMSGPVLYSKGATGPDINVKTAIWRAYNSVKTPADDTVLAPTENELGKNISDRIRNKTLEYTKEYGAVFALDLEQLKNSQYIVNRTECKIYAGNRERCLNVTILTENNSNKEYTVGGDVSTNANAVLSTTTHLELREFGLYDVLKAFMQNNIPARTGTGPASTGENLLAETIEADTACPAGVNCDWDTSTSTTQYCPTQDTCAYSASGNNAKLDYSCVPALQSPASKATIVNSIQTKIQKIESHINSNLAFLETLYTVICPTGVTGCYGVYNSPYAADKDPITGETYKTGGYQWTLAPPAPRTWTDAVQFSPIDDDYTILWWAQANDGKCSLPRDIAPGIGGSTYLTDTQPSSPVNDNGKDAGFASKTNYPEGTACSDSYYTGCHKVNKYVYSYGSSSWITQCDGASGDCYTSGTVLHECEDPAHRTDPAHTTCGVAPAGDGWCDEVISRRHWTDYGTASCPYSCPWTTCHEDRTTASCEETDESPIIDSVSRYTHCDITYDIYGHFKYRAVIDPLLVTVIDKTKLIPVTNLYGDKVQENPRMSAIYSAVINEAPETGDGCKDLEAGENKTGERYYHAGDNAYDPCPIGRNNTAQNPGYY